MFAVEPFVDQTVGGLLPQNNTQGHFTSQELYELDFLTNTENFQSHGNKKADVSLTSEKLQCSFALCAEFLSDLNMFLVLLSVISQQ